MNQQINKTDNNDFIPSHFLTVYTRENNSFEKYLEVGEIIKGKSGYEVSNSMPADEEFLQDLANSIITQNFKVLKWKGLIPNNILYCHSENEKPTIVWHRQPEKRKLYFDEEMGIDSDFYHLPNLLFFVHNEILSVFRLGQNPRLTSYLYMVPLPNIYENSSVCLGNGKTEKAKCLEEYIENTEKLFYCTRFNALHHKKFGKGIVFADLIKKKDINIFPLVKSKQKTLKNLFNELS